MVESDIKWNADYDMKRRLVNVRDVDGLITADTVPWRNIDDFEEARDRLEDWKQSQRRVLKTAQDYEDMIAWGEMRMNRKGQAHVAKQAAAARRRPCSRYSHGARSALANGSRSKPPRKRRCGCRQCAGVKITEIDMKNARRRGAKR